MSSSSIATNDAFVDKPSGDNDIRTMIHNMFQCEGGLARPSRYTVLNDGTIIFLFSTDDGVQHLYSYAKGENVDVCQQIVVLPDASTELSTEEKLLRERMRARGSGVIEYHVHQDTRQIMVPANGNIYYGVLPVDAARRRVRPVELRPMSSSSSSSSPRMDVKWSPDGRCVSFTRDHDLWMVDVASGRERQLTRVHEANASRTLGTADYIMQEEFDRYTGYWWSPHVVITVDGTLMYHVLAFEVDLTDVPTLTIANPSVSSAESHTHVFPRPGEANAVTSVKVLRIHVDPTAAGNSNDDGNDDGDDGVRSVDVLRMRVPISDAFPWCEYVVRATWFPDGESFALQLLDRRQQRLELHRFGVHTHMVAESPGVSYVLPSNSAQSPAGTLVHRELSDVWVNVADIMHICDDGNSIVWTSEVNGYRHLYLLDASSASSSDDDDTTSSSKSSRLLTDGDKWVVLNGSFAVDEENKLVYFTGTRDSVTETHAYVTSFGEGPQQQQQQQQRLTPLGRTNEVVVFSSRGTHMVCLSSSLVDVAQVSAYANKPLAAPAAVAAMDVAECTLRGTLNGSFTSVKMPIFSVRPPRLITIPSDAGDLHGLVYLPPGVTLDDVADNANDGGSNKLPLLVYVYGGPHVQLVKNAHTWTCRWRFQFLARLGYVVAMVDGRGSYNRGLRFEGHLKHCMGTVELQDQVALVQHLCTTLNVCDPARIAIMGWSYGGYMSLMALCQRPDVFRLCISGAPVTLWEGYDTGYTERYMDTPANNPEGYARGSVLTHAAGFPDEEDRVVICHGLIDENVHFTHTAELVQCLVELDKPYTLKVFPKERHGLRSIVSNRNHQRWLVRYLAKHL